MGLEDKANNGDTVSTLGLDEVGMLVAKLMGIKDVSPFETAVFRGDILDRGRLNLVDPHDPDIIPLHVEHYETWEEAEVGHFNIIGQLNAGTLVFVPPTA